MAKLISICWRDIPAQVIGRDGQTKVTKDLTPRFAKAINRAAMRASRGSSDADLAEWRRETEVVSGDLQSLVADRVTKLEQEFDDDHLESVIKAGGKQVEKTR